MSGFNWISSNVGSMDQLVREVDNALTEIEKIAKRGFVNNGALENASGSYQYVEDGVLKFYNKDTGIVTDIT